RWRVETGGRIDLVGASIRVNDADVTLHGPGANFTALGALERNTGALTISGSGTLTLGQNLTNEGSVRIDRGMLTVDDLVITDDASLRLTLGDGVRGVGWGAVTAGGHAMLGGLLRIDLAPSFAPVWGDEFDVVRAGSLS